MSSFKTKKISKGSHFPLQHKIKNESIETTMPKKSQTKTFHSVRKIVGILLVFSSIIFLSILGLKAAGNYGLSDKFEEIKVFNPIISAINGTVKNTDDAKKGSKNILIGGIGGKGHDGGELTDSLMLANLNYDNKTVTLLSIPRDLYVAYPQGKNAVAGKINALYPIGQTARQGVNYLAQKVSEITGEPIHHYVIIDFSGFKSVVDALGGVEVDVPNDIYDREYPNENWGYQIFSLKKGLQTLDGDTALKFARSRHSSSDFDRSNRQQLLIKAIKDKALSLGVLTNPGKISNLIASIRSNLSTDLTVGDIADMGLNFKDIDNKNIIMYSLNNECITGGGCKTGAFLYNPTIDTFGTWALLPSGASRSRLSRYEAINQYVKLIFQYPQIQHSEHAISIITTNKNIAAAREIRSEMQKLGFPIDFASSISQTGGTIEKTRIISYWDESTGSGYNKNHPVIGAIESIEPQIEIEFQNHNNFVTDKGPQIEIIVGNDIGSYFQFSQNVNSATSSSTQINLQNNINTISSENITPEG